MKCKNNILVATSLAMALSGNIFAQDSYTIQNKTLQEALEIISKQSSFSYIATDKLLQLKKINSIENIESVEKALELLLKGTGLKAIIKNKTIVITEDNVKKNSDKDLGNITVTDTVYKGYAEVESTIGTKTDLEWLKVPQSVSLVTRTEINDKGATHLIEALDGVSGVTNTLGEGSRDQFVIRGFDGLNDTYRDGLRDDANIQSYRSLANVDHVEIVKGPAGALYGRGSAGGIINLVTKRATGEEFTKLNLSLGSNNEVVTQLDSSTQITDNLNARINLERRKGDSYVDNVDYEDYFIAPTFRYTPTDNQTIDVDLEYSHQELVPYRGVPSVDGKPLNVDVSTFYGSKNDYQKSDTFKFALNYKIVLDDTITWNNRISYNRVNLKQQGTRQSSTDLTTNSVNQTVNNFEYDPRTTTAVQSELTWKKNNHEFLTGIDYNEIDINLNLASNTLDANNLYDPISLSVESPGFPAFRTNNTKSLGIYLQDVYTVGKLSLLGTIRHDSTKLEQQKEGLSKENLEDDKISYRIGSVYKLTDDLSTYATYSKSWQLPYAGSFINPSLAEFFSTELKEVGLKAYLLDDALMINTAIFQINQEQPQTNVDGDVISKIEAKHEGIELELRGQVTDALSVSTGYTYLNARDKSTNKKPNDVADQLFSLSTTYQLNYNWRLGGTFKYVGERYSGNNEAVKLDAYKTIDLLTAYRFGKQQIQLNAYNILNEKYFIGATGGSSGLNQIGYGSPRSFMITYKYEF